MITAICTSAAGIRLKTLGAAPKLDAAKCSGPPTGLSRLRKPRRDMKVRFKVAKSPHLLRLAFPDR